MQNKTNEDNKRGYGRGSGRGRHPGRGRGRGLRWMGDYSLIDVRLIEPALLAFLNEEKMHGYGLLEKLEGIGLTSINPSVVYRILREYEEIGLVESGWEDERTQGPPRRVYLLTEKGKEALIRAEASLQETADRIRKIIERIQAEKE